MCFHLTLSLVTTILTYLSHTDSFWGFVGIRGAQSSSGYLAWFQPRFGKGADLHANRKGSMVEISVRTSTR